MAISAPRMLALLASVAAFAATAAPAQADGEVNIYSSRHYDTDERLYSDFTEATGIEINLIEGKEDELIERMKAEGANSPADVFITADAGLAKIVVKNMRLAETGCVQNRSETFSDGLE